MRLKKISRKFLLDVAIGFGIVMLMAVTMASSGLLFYMIAQTLLR